MRDMFLNKKGQVMYKHFVSKPSLFVLSALFLFYYLLNLLMPLSFGDDYLYAFVWQGKPMFVPLTEDAIRVSSLSNFIASQLSFYLTWSGRFVNNSLAQLFAWAGKNIFNICNAAAALLMIIEIYWCANRGEISCNIKLGIFCWIFFMLWVFTPQFPSVYFWLVGSCHYLWPAVLLLGFLLPYIRKYYNSKEMKAEGRWFIVFIFIFGIIAGCTNENSICWIILMLLFFILNLRKEKANEIWMYTGFAGLVFGYVLLMLSPGNYARLLSVHGHDWFTAKKILDNLFVFSQVMVWQFILWYFCLRSLLKVSSVVESYEVNLWKKLQKDILLVKVFCIIALGMSAIMLFSPEFHLRSGFPGTVQLIVAVGIVLRIQSEYGIELLQRNVKKFLTYVGVTWFVITAGVTFNFLYEHYLWNAKLLSTVSTLQMKNNEKDMIECVEPFQTTSKIEDFLSGYHTFENRLSEDEKSWENVAFSRFYGIKGIRMLKKE